MKSQRGAKRRERKRAAISMHQAYDLLFESQQLARAGKISLAERTARLADNHTKIADRLSNVGRSLRIIMQANLNAARDFAAREEKIARREQALENGDLHHQNVGDDHRRYRGY